MLVDETVRDMFKRSMASTVTVKNTQPRCMMKYIVGDL